MKDIKEFLIKAKIVLDRGRHWLGYMTFSMMIFITITSMKQYSYFDFLSGRYWIIILVSACFFILFVVGYIELKYLGTYQKEIDVLVRINPFYKKLLENDKKMLEKLDEMLNDKHKKCRG